MKTSLRLLAFLSIIGSVLADEAASRKSAETILEITNASGAMKTGFIATIAPMIANMKRQGMPEAAGTEMTAAMSEWFDAEIKWVEIKPKIVDLYVREFTEQELKDLLAFYQTPSGKKAIIKLPVVMQQGAVIGQEYAAKKQDSLKLKVQAIVDKYRPK
uniref:DUF2059 domain-containing protein n=1 Tax=uncultured Verrucomicrobiota bacterium TaxID=156588 RepID=D2DXS9_9BACT|nr:hypothetical protein [uncultured Verrucomicrobiota bacterium]